ncbi:hypothetical protein ABZT51_45985 [Streptomyces sp. NPDC005373]|uniref:hypothetical protein n=1 Tax=Streptomyces sp. NPDC005373 TaxID=3156879 RepID=UPI0033B173A3
MTSESPSPFTDPHDATADALDPRPELPGPQADPTTQGHFTRAQLTHKRRGQHDTSRGDHSAGGDEGPEDAHTNAVFQ